MPPNSHTRTYADVSQRLHVYIATRHPFRLEHWDVNNENVHGNFYEEATGHVNITMDIFSAVRSMDPKPKLFLNDFAIVSSGQFTQV